MSVRRLVGAVVLLAACSGGDGSTFGRAEDAMRDLERGELSVVLKAGKNGFRVEGRYDEAGGGDLPVFDFAFTEIVGEAEGVVRVVSDGSSAVIASGDVVDDIAEDDLESLRLSDGEAFADLGVGSWVDAAEEDERGEGVVVHGRVRVVDFLVDVSKLASQVLTELEPLDESGAEALVEHVRSSTIEIEIDENDLPRSVDATVGFDGEVPEALEEALGPYAAASLRLTVTLAPLEDELTVELPSPTR